MQETHQRVVPVFNCTTGNNALRSLPLLVALFLIHDHVRYHCPSTRTLILFDMEL